MAQAPKKPQKSGGGGGLVGIILVTLLAAAGGGGFGFFLYQQFSAPPKKAAAAVHPAALANAGKPEEEAEPIIRNVIPLNPIVVNLAEPADAWLRIEATVVIEGMKEGADALALRITEDLTAYLKTSTLTQFEGPSGFQSLREDLVDRAKIRDGQHVKDLVIHGIVLE